MLRFENGLLISAATSALMIDWARDLSPSEYVEDGVVVPEKFEGEGVVVPDSLTPNVLVYALKIATVAWLAPAPTSGLLVEWRRPLITLFLRGQNRYPFDFRVYSLAKHVKFSKYLHLLLTPFPKLCTQDLRDPTLIKIWRLHLSRQFQLRCKGVVVISSAIGEQRAWLG